MHEVRPSEVQNRHHSLFVPVALVDFFVVSVPQVFIPELIVLLRLEYERACLVGGILRGCLFSFIFLSLRFYLVLEGDKQNTNIKVSIHCCFDHFQEGK